MKKFLFFPLLIIVTTLHAQSPDDVLHYSFFPQNADARTLAIGGAMGSLGGDISATYVNPAGLGQYRTSEFVFTPGMNFNTNNTNYRGTNTQNNKSSFGMGPIGFVFGFGDAYKPNTSHAISIAVTQTANFNNTVYYSGLNNYSSFSEQWAEETAQSGESLTGVLNDPQYAYGSAPAIYNYLVDTFTVGGVTQVKGLPEFLLANGEALKQENTIVTTGGIYEVALGFATNKNDRWMFGGTLGIPIINYHRVSTFKESDTSANTSNDFGYFSYTDDHHISGAGVNLKMGVIFKPKEYIRLGFAFHTPTFYSSLEELHSSNLVSQTEGYSGSGHADSINSSLFIGGPGINNYNFYTPLKMIFSASYVFREVEDITKQRAFLTADIEFVDNHGAKYSDANDITSDVQQQTSDDYYHALRNVIKSQYKGSFNFRAGGELKFNTIMGRLGFAYYGNPYQDPALKASSTVLSAGIGYRDKGYFIDLTYVHTVTKDVNFPYRLSDKDNTFANVQDLRQSIVATFGIKL